MLSTSPVSYLFKDLYKQLLNKLVFWNNYISSHSGSCSQNLGTKLEQQGKTEMRFRMQLWVYLRITTLTLSVQILGFLLKQNIE